MWLALLLSRESQSGILTGNIAYLPTQGSLDNPIAPIPQTSEPHVSETGSNSCGPGAAKKLLYPTRQKFAVVGPHSVKFPTGDYG